MGTIVSRRLRCQRMLSILVVLFVASCDEVSSCTATVSTTTPSPLLCATCTGTDINFIMTGQGATDFSPPAGTPSANAADCNQLTLTCLPGAGGVSTIDDGAGTGTVTYDQQIGTSMVVLTCNAMGQWTFTLAGVTVVVTDIRCAAT